MCGIAGFALQPDLDRKLLEIASGQPLARRLGSYPQDVLLIDIEGHVDRIELHDGGKLGRRSGADQFADRDEMGADDAVERRGDIGIAEIDGGDLGVDLGLLQVGLGIVARRGGLIEGGLRDRLPRNQVRLALVVGLGLFQRRLGARFGRLRLLELEPVGLGLDREQRGAFLHEGTVLIVDRLQHALHPRHQIDRLDRRGIAGRTPDSG